MSTPKKLTIERTSREVIERKLLTALNQEGVVAALLTLKDLNTIITALYGCHDDRATKMCADLIRLRKEAFGA